jgi:hypothetical protein
LRTGSTNTQTAVAGTANTGGGGGAGSYTVSGAAGGKGVVIVRYLTSGAVYYSSITGGTITTSGNYTIHTFNDTGSLVLS